MTKQGQKLRTWCLGPLRN